MTDLTDANRRDFLAAAVATGLAAPAAAAGGRAGDLTEAFAAAFAGPVSDTAARLAFLTEDAVIVVDDVPFPLDRTGYADHLRFHADKWQSLEWRWHDVVAREHGGTGIVSAFYNGRGKPRDAGFRLRPGYATAVCVRLPQGWRAIALHMSPLAGQLLDASPS